MFYFREQQTGEGGVIDVAFTDRHGGVSAAPYDSLNLANGGGDDPVAVLRNRALLARALRTDAPGVGSLVAMHQVHGDQVLRVPGPEVPGADAAEGLPACDGLVTDAVDLTLMVRVADCVPLLLADLDLGLVGAVHAGRPGLVAGVVPRALDRLADLGARSVVAWMGPHICGGCYEVPAEMRDDVVAVVPAAYAETTWGTPSVDIGAGVTAQLEERGVAVRRVEGCTRETADLYSYRRDGHGAGRFAGVIRRTALTGSAGNPG